MPVGESTTSGASASQLHDPIAYELVRAMSPAEFIGLATRLNDRRDQLSSMRDDQTYERIPAAQREEQLLASIGAIALEKVPLTEEDQGRDAAVIRMARQMGEGGLGGLWRAESTVDHLLAVRAQFERQPNGPYLLFQEQNGGLMVEAGRTSDEASWRISSEQIRGYGVLLTPEVVIGKMGESRRDERQLVCDPWCRIVTDDQIPRYLIWDYLGSAGSDGDDEHYQQFLRGHFGEGEDVTVFPERATMLALGDEGVKNLISEFGRLTEEHYTKTPLGRLEFQRINRQANEALRRVIEGEPTITFSPRPNLRADYEKVLTDELRHMARQVHLKPEEGIDFYYNIIEMWYSRGGTLDVTQLSRWVTDSMHQRHGSDGISYDDLLTAVKAEIEDEIRVQQEQIAQRSIQRDS